MEVSRNSLRENVANHMQMPSLSVVLHKYQVAAKACTDLGFVVKYWKPHAAAVRISIDLASKVCSMHNSIKLRSTFPDRDTLPLVLPSVDTANHNVSFSELNAQNSRRVKEEGDR